MKWTYSIRNKAAASAALLSLCVLVLFSNLIDRQHTDTVQQSISTLYKDRLLAEAYILEMTSDIHQIKDRLNSTEWSNDGQDERIGILLADTHTASRAYQKTELTKNESEIFSELQLILNELGSTRLKDAGLMLENTNRALSLLKGLSEIQLDESKLIMNQAESYYTTGKASSQFAAAIIIVILLVLQAIALTSKTLETDNYKSVHHLN